ncbi:MAG: restriction endonuclease subunit S [Methylococcales bacterium]
MANLQPYNKYNPIVYDYVNQLPEDWRLLPNIAIFEERVERGKEDYELLSISISKGVVKQSDMDKKDISSPDKSNYKIVRVGDIAYGMEFRKGAVGYSIYEGIVSPVYTILKPRKNNEVNPKFFHYVFRTAYYKNYIWRNVYGIGEHFLPCRFTHFKRMYSIVPPLDIQNSIVEYLDKKNNEIDRFIRNKERLIKLLESQRKAIITKTIFQDNFSVKPLKYLVSKVGSGVTPLGGANVYISEGVCFLRSQNIHFDGLRLEDVAFISEKIHSKMKYTKVKKNDVLLNITGASIGRCCAIKENIEANVNQHVCIIRPKKNLNSKFLAYYLASTTIQNLIRNNQDGASREGLSFSEIKSFPVPVVDIDKQVEIAKQIMEKDVEIDLAISKAQQEITSIKEYREALITDLVTGKRQLKHNSS